MMNSSKPTILSNLHHIAPTCNHPELEQPFAITDFDTGVYMSNFRSSYFPGNPYFLGQVAIREYQGLSLACNLED